MPKGIIATVDNGFAQLDFVDPELRGPALQALIDIGGPETIETVTRVGPRRQYRVPEGNAREAGLLDEADTEVRPRSAGQDTGAAQALADADPNANPGDDGADWHTPVAEYTSANSFVGQVPNEEVLDRPQVHTGDAGSYGGSGDTPLHADVIGHVLENSSVRAVGGVDPNITESNAEQQIPASQLNLALKGQEAALGSDPGGYAPQPGGQSIAEDYTSVQATREPAQDYPSGEPNKNWKRPELDAYALAVKSLDTTELPSKDAVLDAINGGK
jgi:hypothetical protein